MELMKRLLEAAKADRKKIVLPEGSEERTIKAAFYIQREKLAFPILIGNKEEILNKASSFDIDL